MKKIYFTFVFLLSILTFFITYASSQTSNDQKNANSKSLLWKISKANNPHIGYIFGTIHLIKKDKYFFTDQMKKAFNESEKIVFELDMSMLDDLNIILELIPKLMMQNDTTIKDLISEQDYILFDQTFSKLGFPSTLLERLKPIFLTAIVQSPELTIDQNGQMTSYEMELTEMAKKQNKSIDGIETIDEQLSAIDQTPLKDQASIMMEMIKNKSEAFQMDEMVNLYLNQDIAGLYQFINKESNVTEQKMMQSILMDRNIRWISRIEKLMCEKNFFLAVGAGHLAGEEGVLNLLQKQGYYVEAIF